MRRIFLSIILLLALTPLRAQMQEIERLIPKVLRILPHDAEAFTQGLLWHEGYIYESTGLYGESTLRRVHIESGQPQVMLSIDAAYFAEGLERVDDKLIQLTWKAGVAFVYDSASFDLLDTIEYEGEGWGLCYDGRFLFMSDSTPYLSVRDAETFELIVRAAVTYQGQIVRRSC